MKLKICLFFLTTFISINCIAQIKSKDVLFTVAEEPVLASEFIRVYKKNLDLVQDESQKNIDDYLDLYVNYKLKLSEAKALGFDKKETYLNEFNKYKKQLVKNYLTDSTVSDKLVEEAYNRISFDVNVNHILFFLDEKSEDTITAYNKALEFRTLLQNEKDFSKVKAQVHNGETIVAEQLGYFTGFKMVYYFENVAYNTEVGEVSMPFRTKFGYHVLKVEDKRASKGYVTAAHIMVSNNQKDNSINPEDRIKEIYNLLQQGQSFGSLAKQYSDDRSTSNKGGELNEFKSSQLGSVEFENQVFALENSGDITKPFKTVYGWHIAKLINKRAIGTFEEIKSRLEAQVKKDPRSQLINEKFYEGLKKRYNVPASVDLSYFETILDDRVYSNEWSVPVDIDQNKILIDFGDKQLTYHNFALYMESSQKQMNKGQTYASFVKQLFESYLRKRIMAYHEDNLEYINPEYAAVLSEYRDGLLLFDLMQEKIWDAVKEDSVGLQSHYNENKGKYIWEKRIDAVVITSPSMENIEKAKVLLEEGKTEEEIKEALNTKETQGVIVTSGKFIKNHRSIPKALDFKEGISNIYNENDNYYVVLVRKVLDETEKTFKEAKGKVISEYQEIVEKNWINNLKEKYPVTVNMKVLKRVKKALKQ